MNLPSVLLSRCKKVSTFYGLSTNLFADSTINILDQRELNAMEIGGKNLEAFVAEHAAKQYYLNCLIFLATIHIIGFYISWKFV